jgi:hypothetical protein
VRQARRVVEGKAAGNLAKAASADVDVAAADGIAGVVSANVSPASRRQRRVSRMCHRRRARMTTIL